MEKRLRIDIVLFLCVVFVAVAGIFTLYTQETIGAENGESRWVRQAVFFGVGLAFCFILRKINYQFLGGYAVVAYGIGLLLLLVTLIPFIGSEVKGARSWIRLGWFGIQTSEVASLATILLLAKYLELKEREMERIPSLFIPFVIAVVPMLLIVIQPDFGGAFSLAPVLLSMLFIAGADMYHIGSVLAFFSVALSIPLYIEYHNITLVEPLLGHMSDLGQTSLIPAVRILKTDVWKFLENSVIPAGVDGTDREYLAGILSNGKIMAAFREASLAVRYESGGLLLRIMENDALLVIVGVILSLAALVLFIIRFTQGTSMQALRKLYIPLGVLGVSLLSAVAVHLTFSFKYHQVVRVTAFINPDKFPRDLAYQIRASKAAIGSGEMTGRGFFQGDMTVGDRPLVPEAYTDFIFTSWSERTGFLGSVLLLLALLGIPLRGMQISFEARDRLGSLLAAGISFMFFYHILFNTGIALGLLPVTGLPLSFMSYGGSHLMTCMIAVGMLLSIHRKRYAN